MAKVCVVGGGWFGCHIALELKARGYDVTLVEKEARIFQGISGKFGIRLHAGPHYPLSPATRETCHRGLEEFYKLYPGLVVEHESAIYALGNQDAEDRPPKVGKEAFESVCQEFKYKSQVNWEASGYHDLLTASSLDEPSAVLGERLRKAFEAKLEAAGVRVVCHYKVKKFEPCEAGQVALKIDGKVETFDHLVNATSYQDLLPKEPLPLDIKVVYQPCLALVYKDSESSGRPVSLIVMDGWFPCLMPYCDSTAENKKFDGKYIMTHGLYTIMGSYSTAEEANEILANLSPEYIEKFVRPNCEREMNRFWPEFAARFTYMGEWKGSTLAKIITNSEFRSAVTFASEQKFNDLSVKLIHVIPGKITNVFDAANEVLAVIEQKNLIQEGNFQYMQGGVMDKSQSELRETLGNTDRRTTNLQTYAKWLEENKVSSIGEGVSYGRFFPSSETSKITPDVVQRIAPEEGRNFCNTDRGYP